MVARLGRRISTSFNGQDPSRQLAAAVSPLGPQSTCRIKQPAPSGTGELAPYKPEQNRPFLELNFLNSEWLLLSR